MIFKKDNKDNKKYSFNNNNSFSYKGFENCLSSRSCYNSRCLELFYFIVSIKFKDIFARGFTVDERMQSLNNVYGISFDSLNNNILNFYDILILSMTNTILDYVLVFNSELTLPSENDVFIGFLSKSTILANQNEDFYNNIDNRLKFSFLEDKLYCITEPYLKRTIEQFELMQNRIVHGTKTILQKSDSGMLARNDQSQIEAFVAQNVAESKAYLKNNEKSVLTVPSDTNVLFPTADVTQIDKAYMRAIEWLLAFFRMPRTKFFGDSPSGFQSTGNLEFLNYEQSLDELFDSKMKPILQHISNILGVENEVTPISFYKLRLLESINNVRATTNSMQIEKYCDNMITAISNIEPMENNNIATTTENINEIENEI